MRADVHARVHAQRSRLPHLDGLLWEKHAWKVQWMEIEDSWEMSFDWGGMGLIEDFANIFLPSFRKGEEGNWKRKIEKVFRKKNFRIGICFETIITSKSNGRREEGIFLVALFPLFFLGEASWIWMEQRERGILYFDEWTFSVVEARRIMWRKGWFKNARIITSCVRIIKMRGTLCEKSCVTRVFFEYVGNYNSVHLFFFFDYISNLRNGFLLLVSYVFIFNCHAVSTRENGNYFFFSPLNNGRFVFSALCTRRVEFLDSLFHRYPLRVGRKNQRA